MPSIELDLTYDAVWAVVMNADALTHEALEALIFVCVEFV